MLFSAYTKLRASSYNGTVVIDSEDTNVYAQTAYVSQQLRGELLIKRKHEYVNCPDLLSAEVSSIIIPLHVITVSDHTSSFYGHGKKQVLSKVINDLDAGELLKQVGEHVELHKEVEVDMTAFVICNIYAEHGDRGQARASKWHKLKKKSTMRLPPDTNSSNFHLQRTNFIAYCQRHNALQEHPSALGHGWEIMNGKCGPVRHTLPALPEQLTRFDVPADIVDNSSSDDEMSEYGELTDSDED